ncbi:hypothetical protein GCM10022251_05070 [Phytohabitans flavus]|uniref:Uncharacterized protein n=1 Tax=Phytohabitans flavus TaxID=1076124 RepID=A0A6F8Y2Y1_9ACTN|nr:hypothetical protein [Phytohabitans flavus]BCB80331.1 hypothetical protein Pflav_067410 [Phytohabitans flavus]
MPASAPQSERPGRQLLTVAFWVGVGLAPLAALLLLVGQSAGVLRVAAVLAVFAIVLIGVSITLRRDAETVRIDLEETLLEEIDTLRGDVRNDIETAARATHKAFGEKLQTLNETVQALRMQMQLDAARGQAAPPPPATRGAAEPPQVGYGRAGYPQQEAPAVAGHAAIPQPPAAGHAGGRARVPGVVRHTETVQVTTRQTIVDQGDDPDPSGQSYGATSYGSNGYGSAESYGGNGSYGDWPASAPPAPRSPARGRRAAEPEEESWSEQRLRGGDGRRPRPYERGDADAGGDDGRWTGMRAGDRWASVRSDDRGRELRMGERRAAMHQDESGSEMRIEDRWASVRREEPRRDEYRADPEWGGGGYGDGGGQDAPWTQDRWERPSAPAALPAGGIEPTTSWGQQWGTPEREPAGRRRRYRDEDDPYR